MKILENIRKYTTTDSPVSISISSTPVMFSLFACRSVFGLCRTECAVTLIKPGTGFFLDRDDLRKTTENHKVATVLKNLSKTRKHKQLLKIYYH